MAALVHAPAQRLDELVALGFDLVFGVKDLLSLAVLLAFQICCCSRRFDQAARFALTTERLPNSSADAVF